MPGSNLVDVGGALGRVELKLNDGLGEDRPQIVRIKHVQERLGDFGELVVELAMDSSGQESEGLDQALNMRIFADSSGFSRRRPCNLWILLREFARHLADKLQLLAHSKGSSSSITSLPPGDGDPARVAVQGTSNGDRLPVTIRLRSNASI